uniref:EGF-like domain-containing protein n=1 Tax=Astyanax mexicanus TaxID=7994 RepID=A0A3B1JZZ4_ASTMX
HCAPGFQGSHCEQDIDECLSQPCQNGAICLDGIDVYQCFCVPGFQGYHCEIDINECASRPCENNGTCINGKDRYICDCLVGFTGKNAVEIDECEAAPCQNGATCRDGVGLYECECLPGFDGIDCEVDIDECASDPCLNSGECVDMINSYECDCRGTGFIGEICEEDILECESDPCQHGSTCLEGVNHYTCLCWPGNLTLQKTCCLTSFTHILLAALCGRWWLLDMGIINTVSTKIKKHINFSHIVQHKYNPKKQTKKQQLCSFILIACAFLSDRRTRVLARFRQSHFFPHRLPFTLFSNCCKSHNFRARTTKFTRHTELAETFQTIC